MTDKFAPWATPAPSRRHRLRWVQNRQTHYAAIFLIIVLSIGMVIASYNLSSRFLSLHAASNVDLLSSQAAEALSVPLAQHDDRFVNRYIGQLTSSHIVDEVSVFDVYGKQLYGDVSVHSLASSETESPPIVKMLEIEDPHGEPIGVLRLIINNDAVLAKERTLITQQYGLLVAATTLGCFLGMIVTLGVWRYRLLLPYFIRWLNGMILKRRQKDA